MDSDKKASNKDIKEMRNIMREMIDQIIWLEEDSSSEDDKKTSNVKQLTVFR